MSLVGPFHQSRKLIELVFCQRLSVGRTAAPLSFYPYGVSVMGYAMPRLHASIYVLHWLTILRYPKVGADAAALIYR